MTRDSAKTVYVLIYCPPDDTVRVYGVFETAADAWGNAQGWVSQDGSEYVLARFTVRETPLYKSRPALSSGAA